MVTKIDVALVNYFSLDSGGGAAGECAWVCAGSRVWCACKHCTACGSVLSRSTSVLTFSADAAV